MKTIALLTFKNEEWVIKEYINNIKKITNYIIAYDDNSSDNSRTILEEAGAQIISNNYKKDSYFAEFEIRKELLKKGREAGGTHFICLDADEIFSRKFIESGVKQIQLLKSGESLWLDWVNLYGGLNTERIDGVYKRISKSFIFCDNKKMDFTYAFVGVSRTPTINQQKNYILNRSDGCVIHLQFLNKDRSSLKRIWYMCSEHIKGDRSPLRINVTYEIQKNKKNIKTRTLDHISRFDILDKTIIQYDYKDDWRFKEICGWFDKYGIDFFEKLDIWDYFCFKEEFKTRLNRLPATKRIPSIILKLNDLKNKIKKVIKRIWTK